MGKGSQVLPAPGGGGFGLVEKPLLPFLFIRVHTQNRSNGFEFLRAPQGFEFLLPGFLSVLSFSFSASKAGLGFSSKGTTQAGGSLKASRPPRLRPNGPARHSLPSFQERSREKTFVLELSIGGHLEMGQEQAVPGPGGCHVKQPGILSFTLKLFLLLSPRHN